jgi:hypothetical protein
MLALVLAASPVFAADIFSDVPKTHWAYDAIQNAVDAGILQGYDGKFHGQRLLNRYQMAVIVDKLMKAVKGNPMAAKADGGKTVANLEALTIEFADELALLNVKVSTLEDGYTELKKQVEGMKGGSSGVSAGGLGFTAFASFGLISTDDCQVEDSTNPAGDYYMGTQTRYADSADSLFFTLPQVSIGVDKEVNPGVYFHAQFDYSSDVSGSYTTYASSHDSGGVQINEVYFLVDELLGDIGAKIGAFALPFSMEHNGPFRTLNHTITPSFANTFNESWRVYGLEFQKIKDVNPEDIFFKVAIVSGSDSPRWDSFPMVNDQVVGINSLESDDGFGYYFQVGKKPVDKKGFGWNLSYFANGGEPGAPTAATVHSQSEDIDFWQIGLEWWGEKFGVIAQYLDGSIEETQELVSDPVYEFDINTWFILLNFIIDDKNNVSLRYDTWEIDAAGHDEDVDGTAWTLGFNHKVTENSMFQFEWLSPDIDTEIGYADSDDDIIQLRYKVHF